MPRYVRHWNLTTSRPAAGTLWQDLNFEGTFPPTGWDLSTFFPTGASYAQVADPLGAEGNVLRLRCVDATPTLPTDYTNAALQQAALSVHDKADAHATLGAETWYRYRVMFPAGCVFCNGFSNFLIEWHTQETGPLSPGMFAYGDYPLTSGGTTTGKFVFVMRSGTTASPVEVYYPGVGLSGVSTLAAANGIAITTNHWYDIVFHIKWDTSSTNGLFEWWVDGTKISSAVGATYYSDAGEILGNAVYVYRYNVTGDETAYYGMIRIGSTAAAVGFTP